MRNAPVTTGAVLETTGQAGKQKRAEAVEETSEVDGEQEIEANQGAHHIHDIVYTTTPITTTKPAHDEYSLGDISSDEEVEQGDVAEEDEPVTTEKKWRIVETMTRVEETVREFFAGSKEKQLSKGELLLMPSETELPPISYLVRGRVVQYDIDDEGNRSILNTFKPGAFFPLSAAINQTPTTYFFEAATPVVVRQMDAREVEEFLRAQPEVVYDVLSRLYRGVDGVLGRMAQLLHGNAKSRVYYELNVLARRFGVATAGGIDVAVTASQLAEMTGLTRETVSRTLQSLQRDDIVRLRRGVVTLLDATLEK